MQQVFVNLAFTPGSVDSELDTGFEVGMGPIGDF